MEVEDGLAEAIRSDHSESVWNNLGQSKFLSMKNVNMFKREGS
jgi:hypothetical protein